MEKQPKSWFSSLLRQELFQQVALSQGHVVRLILALERRAAKLGDLHGALLLAMLLSDLARHPMGMMDEFIGNGSDVIEDMFIMLVYR